MPDVVVTVPKNFTHPSAPGKKWLAAWLGEGDAPGTPWSGTDWYFTTYGPIPSIKPGERIYVVCDRALNHEQARVGSRTPTLPRRRAEANTRGPGGVFLISLLPSNRCVA
jgi:hypothetical protein